MGGRRQINSAPGAKYCEAQQILDRRLQWPEKKSGSNVHSAGKSWPGSSLQHSGWSFSTWGSLQRAAALILSSKITSSASGVGGIFVWWYYPLDASVQAPLKWEDARGIEKLRRQCFEWRGFNNHCSIGSWYRLNLQSCMYTPRLAIDRCKDLCLRATNRQTEDKKWASANFARTDHALPGFALAQLHLSSIFIVGQLCTIQERLWRKWSLASNLVLSTLLWSNMRRWQVKDFQRRKVSDIWGKFMFGLCSCSLPQKRSSRTTLELSSPTRPRPAWAAIQLLAGRFKVLELAWGPQCQF